MRFILYSILIISLSPNLYAQKELNKWPFGQKNSNGHPLNVSYVLDFNSLPSNVITIPEYENIFFYYGVYSDSKNGEILYFTNGLRILDGKGDIIQGCDSINYGEYWVQHNELNSGHPTATQSFFIPTSPDKVWLIHQQIEKPVSAESPGIDFTQFTLLVNDGNGFGCILKDEKIRTGAMKPLCMVRHGNGMDWWIIIPDKISNILSKYILSNDGVKWIEDQEIGYEITSSLENSGGFSCFNVQGDQFACYNNIKGHQLFDFDRCTGMFSNVIHIPLDTFHYIGGSLSFSPNGKYLYVPTWFSVIQYDLEALDIPGSADTVVVYDNYVCLPDWGLGAGFFLSTLGPDGKIYITAPNSNNCIHVINRPNLRGKACDVRQHGIITPGITNGGLPGYINYQLGPQIGSPCDPDGG